MSQAKTDIAPSRLLPEVLQPLAELQLLTVFDAGFANPHTLAWLSTRRSRLYCAGLQDVLQAHANTELEQAQWLALLSPLLRFPAGTRLDLCLFWDLPVCMDEAALAALNLLLRPWLSSHSRAHAFTLLKPGPTWPMCDYGIADEARMTIRARGGELPRHARPQARITALLDSFRIGHGVLRSDGLLEMSLLSATPAAPTR